MSETHKELDKTIGKMSQEERMEAFRREIIAPLIADKILDDEEKNLVDVMMLLYCVPDAREPSSDWLINIIRSYEGCDKTKLDEELAVTIEKRLNEPGSVSLSDEHDLKIKLWQGYREKDSDLEAQPSADPLVEKDTTTDSKPSHHLEQLSSALDESPPVSVLKPSEEEFSSPEPPAEIEENEVGGGTEPSASSEVPLAEKDTSDGTVSEIASSSDGLLEEESSPPISPLPPEIEGIEVDTAPSSSVLTLSMGEQSVSCNITTKLSKHSVRQFGEDSQYWDSDWQMTVEKREEGWFIIPNTAAKNETILNGKAISSPTQLSAGDEVGVGRESKNIVKLPLTVTLG